MNERYRVGMFGRWQRPVGAVFALTAALVLAVIAHQSWQGGGGPVAAAMETVAPDGMGAPISTPTFAVTASPSVTPTALPTATPAPTQSPTPPSPTPLPPTPQPTLEPPTPTPEPTATPTPVPQPTPDGVQRTARVPILMYHYVSSPPAGAGAVRRDLSIAPEAFAEHLAYLRDTGYTSISLGDLVLALQTGMPLPERPVVLTFDDGYRDHYEHAYRLLREYGFTGTFFLTTSLIDQGNPDHLTWEQVAEMSAGGMSMEAHAYTHADLEGRTREFLIWQMLGSKEAIEARTGVPVRCFCYPSGAYDGLAQQVLHELGYWAATTVTHGQEHSSAGLFQLRRLRVRGSYSPTQLAALLEAG